MEQLQEKRHSRADSSARTFLLENPAAQDLQGRKPGPKTYSQKFNLGKSFGATSDVSGSIILEANACHQRPRKRVTCVEFVVSAKAQKRKG
jgi:hypothetical protein